MSVCYFIGRYFTITQFKHSPMFSRFGDFFKKKFVEFQDP